MENVFEKEKLKFNLSFLDFIWYSFILIFPVVNTALVIANVIIFCWVAFQCAPFFKTGGLWSIWGTVSIYEIEIIFLHIFCLTLWMFINLKLGVLFLGTAEFELLENGILFKTSKKNIEIPLEKIKYSFESNKHFFFITQPFRVIFIPKRSIPRVKIDDIRKLCSSKTRLKRIEFISSVKSILLMYLIAFIYVATMYMPIKYQTLGINLSTSKNQSFLILQRSLFKEMINPFSIDNINRIYDWHELKIENQLEVFSLPNEKFSSIETKGSGWWTLYMAKGGKIIFVYENSNSLNKPSESPVKYLEFYEGNFRELTNSEITTLPKERDVRKKIMAKENWKKICTYKLEGPLELEPSYFEIIKNKLGFFKKENRYTQKLNNFRVNGENYRLDITEKSPVSVIEPILLDINIEQPLENSKSVYLYQTWIGKTLD